MRTSCINHRPKTPLVVLHQDYLDICGNTAAAIILKILEYWTDVKLDQTKQIEAENARREQAGMELLERDLWIYKTGEDFQEDSLGLLKEHDVARGLKILLDKWFIERRRNPRFSWDRTWQYRLNIDFVNSAVCIPNLYGMVSEPVRDQSRTGTEAIPEITTEITIPEIKESSTASSGEVGKFITEYEAENIYRKVTGHMSIPSLGKDDAIRIICDIARVKGDTTDAYLKPFYTEYLTRQRKDGRKYSSLGFGWLDWAAGETIPEATPAPAAPSLSTVPAVGVRQGNKRSSAEVVDEAFQRIMARKEEEANGIRD